jgi:hypothetical protein
LKRIATSLMIIMVFYGSAFGTTLNHKAAWKVNTETDMTIYKLCRRDGTRTLIGIIPHPTTTCDFPVTFPDNSAGTLSSVLTAVDTNKKESLDSATASYNYNLDTVQLSSLRNLTVQKQ